MEMDLVYQQKIPMDLTTATNVRNIAMYAEAQHYITGLSFQKGFFFLIIIFRGGGGGVHLFICLNFYVSVDVNAVDSQTRPVQSHCQVISLSVLL